MLCKWANVDGPYLTLDITSSLVPRPLPRGKGPGDETKHYSRSTRKVWFTDCACTCEVCMHVCVCVSPVEEQCWHIILLLRARSIVWLVQSVPTLQKFGKGNWIHSRVGNLASSKKLPTCYSIGPLQWQWRIWYIAWLFANYRYWMCNCMHAIRITIIKLPLVA